MIRTGVVSALVDFSDRPSGVLGGIQVELEPLAGCGNCRKTGSCGLQLLPVSGTPISLNCTKTCDAPVRQGDRVNVQLIEPSSGWLRIVCMAYGLPTMGMIIGAVLGYWLATVLQLVAAREFISLLGFFLGLTGGLFAWNRAEKSICGGLISQNQVESATIIDVVANSGEVI